MTILYAGGEDTSFTAIVGATGEVGQDSSGTYSTRVGYPRTSTAIYAANSTNVADPPASRWQTPTFTAGSVVWFHAQIAIQTSTTVNGQQTLIIRSPDGVARVLLRQTGASGTLKASTRNAAGTIVDLATATGVLTIGPCASFDVKVDYSSSGGVQVWLANVLIINYTGDPRTDAATQLNQIEFASANNVGSSNNGTGWSEVIVADEDTRTMALVTRVPQAAGNTQGWTPNTLANISDIAINDSTSISTTVNNTLSGWTMPTTLPGGIWSVRAVVQNARVQIAGTGPQHFDFATRTGGTDYLTGTSRSPGITFANYQQMWLLNPGTGVAWTSAEVTAVGFNLGIQSQA